MIIDIENEKMMMSDPQREFFEQQEKKLEDFLSAEQPGDTTAHDNRRVGNRGDGDGDTWTGDVGRNGGYVDETTFDWMSMAVNDEREDTVEGIVEAPMSGPARGLFNALVSPGQDRDPGLGEHAPKWISEWKKKKSKLLTVQDETRGARQSRFENIDHSRALLDGVAGLDDADEREAGTDVSTLHQAVSEEMAMETVKRKPTFKLHVEFMTPFFPSHKDDEGVCLTMHQPWASLLVYGFKRLEGRVWTTGYRGRLWIHAAAKVPSEDDLEAVCGESASAYHGIAHPPLPQHFPTSALLGCVDLIAVSPKEAALEDTIEGALKRYNRPQQTGYQSLISSNEHNESPYLFVCTAPRALRVPIAVSP